MHWVLWSALGLDPKQQFAVNVWWWCWLQDSSVCENQQLVLFMEVIQHSPVDMENPTFVRGGSQISTDSLHTIYKTFTHPNRCRMSYTWSHKLHKLMSPRWTIPSMKIPLSSSSTPKNWTFLLSWRSWYWQLFTWFLLGIDLIEARRSKVTKKPSKGLHDARPLGIGLRRSYIWSPAQELLIENVFQTLACFLLGPLKTLNFRAALDPRSCYWPNGTKDWKLGYKNSTEWWVTLRTLMQHLPVFATKTAAMMSSAACGNSCGLMTEIGECVSSLCSKLFGVYMRRIMYRTHRWPTRIN